MTAVQGARVGPSAVVRGALGGTLVLATPWARQAIPEADRQAIADRIPDGMTLYLSARTSRMDWTVRLYDRDANPSEPVVELLHQRNAGRGLEAALARMEAWEADDADAMAASNFM